MASGLFDALTHLGDTRLTGRLADLELRAWEAGIRDVVSASVNPLHEPVVPPWASVRVWHAYGVHPSAASAAPPDVLLDALRRRLAEPGVVALGEAGLDGRPGFPPLERQAHLLRLQLDEAVSRDLPVILHGVSATQALLEIVSDYAPRLRFVIHGFMGAPEIAARWVALGGYVSLGPGLLIPRARRVRDAANAIPLNRLLVESDAPDHPRSGEKVGTPGVLNHILDGLCELRGEPRHILAHATAENASLFFGLAHSGTDASLAPWQPGDSPDR